MFRVSALRRAGLAGTGMAAGSLLLLAACSSSTHSASSGSSSASSGSSSGGSATTAGAPASSGPPGSVAAGVTIGAANVAGYGMVLVDGSGHTLYILSSERGGKLTCTDDNGCTKVWPDTELPAGVMAATAGSGINKALLSTVKNAKGSLYVTYGGWPLYTFSGDSGPAQSAGEGINSFGGIWYVLGVSGQPVTAKSTSGSQGGY